MRIGSVEYFCNCLLKNLKEHVTAPNAEGNCVYCGYVCVKREVTEKDLRTVERWGEEILKKKKEALEILIKDLRHNEKVN